MRCKLLIGLFLALACGPARPPDNTERGTADTAGSSPSAGDRSAAEAAIRERETRWRALIAARDTAGIGAFYTRMRSMLPREPRPSAGGTRSVPGGPRRS